MSSRGASVSLLQLLVAQLAALASAQAPCPAGTSGAGGVAPCTPCAANTYALGGAAACASCGAADSVFVSATAGCAPASAANGPVDRLAFFLSGAQADGVAAFSAAVSAAAGLAYAPDRFGAANAAITLPAGAHLDSAAGALAAQLPANNSDASISAWVSCPPVSSPEASVFEYGAPAFAASIQKIGISVVGTAPPGAPGPVAASACDGRWHHVAVSKSGTTLTQYLDGVAVASAANVSLAIPASNASLRIGWNGAPALDNPLVLKNEAIGSTANPPYSAPSLQQFVPPPGVTALNVLVVGGGGGGGGGGSACKGGGGGGGGGVICTSLTVGAGKGINYFVGPGGWGGFSSGTGTGTSLPTLTTTSALAFPSFPQSGTDAGMVGFNSTFGPLVALGGGGGASFFASTNFAPFSGASGGGAGCYYASSAASNRMYPRPNPAHHPNHPPTHPSS